MNNTGTPKSMNTIGQNQFGSTASPQEKVQRTKLFAQSMKNLTIFLVNVVHYSNHIVQHSTPKTQSSMAYQTFSYFTGGGNQTTTGDKGKNDHASKEAPLTAPASKLLLQTILVKQYQG